MESMDTSRVVPACPTGIQMRSTDPQCLRRAVVRGSYLRVFSCSFAWQPRSLQKPSSMMSREHSLLSKEGETSSGEKEGGIPLAYIRSGAAPQPCVMRVDSSSEDRTHGGMYLGAEMHSWSEDEAEVFLSMSIMSAETSWCLERGRWVGGVGWDIHSVGGGGCEGFSSQWVEL